MPQASNVKFQILSQDPSTLLWFVEGELDIENPTSFPVALTYSIKDIQDITKSKGSFSKTFKIPATAHNNHVLQNIFSDSFYDSFAYIENKQSKIFVDGSLIMEGKFKIKATIQDEVPKEYECVVFGENYEWVNALENVNLCDLDFDAGGDLFPNTPSTIQYELEDIEDTWKIEHSGYLHGGVGSHVVYPLVNTGKWTYGDFAHKDDMLPAIFIRDIILCAFAGIGYKVESEFFDTDWFKKLITLSSRQVFEISQDSSVATPYSWEYCTDPDNESAWKIPTNYRNLAEPENVFDGAINFLCTPCCTGCDPDGIWSCANNISDAMFQLFHNGFDEFDDKQIIAGWYWGAYGMYARAGNYFSSSLNYLPFNIGSLCNTGLWIWGMEWNCVWTDPYDYATTLGSIDPLQTHSETISNFSIMQTPQTGEYSFNITCEVEMENQYVIDNVPEEFDPFGNPTNVPYQYRNRGFMYANANGMSWGGTDPMTGLDEYEDFGCQYCARIYLVKIDATDGFHKPYWLDSNCAINLDDFLWHGLFTSWRPDGNLPAQNIKFNLECYDYLIDILDPDDRFYFYVEAHETLVCFWEENGAGGVSNEQHCQLKYRVNDAVTWGGLTDAMVNGGQISINALLPCDVTQLEWINGLTGLFNLYWYADEGTKTIYVEPRDSFFFDRLQAVDWSDMMDMSQETKSEFVYDTLNRDLCFTYENDSSDGFVEERNDRVGQICSLNSYAMDLGNMYKNKDTQIGSEFYAPTYMFNDKVIGTNQDKSPFIPVIHSEYSPIWTAVLNNEYPDKVEDFTARILLWGGLVPVFQADGATNNNRWRWGKENPSDPPTLKKHYPFAGTFNNQNEDFFGSYTIGSITYHPTLPFQDVEANDQVPAATPPYYPYCDGLFKVFWEKNINGLLLRPRIKRVWFKLTAKDIMDFDFRRLVYLDVGTGEGGTYWVVNKIIDYKPAKNEMTKVELYQWFVQKPSKGGRPPKRSIRLSNLGQTRDVPIGRNYQTNIRLENFSDKFVSGNVLKTSATKNNINLTNPVPRNEEGYEDRQAAYPNRKPMMPTDGAMRPQSMSDKESFNIGTNNEVIKGSGTIVIGNNTKSKSGGGIKIGNNVRSVQRYNQQVIVQGGNTRTPAFVIGNDGRFLEGGGGAVLFEDASGNIVEVMTEIGGMDSGEYTKVLKSR